MIIDIDAIRARLAAAKMPPLQVNRCDHARGAINWQVQEADHDGEQHYAVLAQIVDLETRNAKAKATLLCHAPDDIAALLAECEEWQARAVRAETAVAVRSDYFPLLEQRDALRVRVAEMEAVLQDFAEHGVRHDLTPTTTLRIGDTDAVHVFYRCYIGSIDQHVRNVARRALTRGVVAITGETR